MNPRNYNGEMMQTGKEAERIVMRWLRKNPAVMGVADLSDIVTMYQTDADLLIKTRDGQDVLAEVKSDRHIRRNGNLVFELLRIYHNAPQEHAIKLGWGQRTPARWLLVYSPTEKAIYRFSMSTVRAVVQYYTQEYRERSQPRWINTDRTKSTLILLVPMHLFLDHYGRYDVSDLVEQERTCNQPPPQPPQEPSPRQARKASA